MPSATSGAGKALVQNMANALVGQARSSRLAVIAMLAGGHILLEDVPGTGKTLLARSLSSSVKGNFKRVQCTPDLLPSDVSGVNVYDQKEQVFRFVPGPIFTNILLIDEINRATPRTQSALLEAMEEGQVTSDGVTRKLERMFFVIATQNPIESHGTFPLPDAQLDRFMMCLSLGYPNVEQEGEIIKKSMQDGAFHVDSILSTDDVLAARLAVRRVFVHDALVNYIVNIVHATRKHPSILLGVSPRGSQLLVRAAQAAAFVEGRDFVTPDDVKMLAPIVFGHRVSPKVKANRVSHTDLIEKIVETIPVPA
ncbi:MAG: MoxR family ATPase [Cyanobacteria bacterium SZAS LIN-2]|nr:MoxR family ATPase [Cyanobacteria bacterium SZAS LIN-3]MBS1996125.1 MoxR family ATPase [Cyanobacteria bacterium SZAS LIN-2]